MKIFNNKIFLVSFAFIVGSLLTYSLVSLESEKINTRKELNRVAQGITRQGGAHNSNLKTNRAHVRNLDIQKDLDDMSKRHRKIMDRMMKAFDQSFAANMDIDMNMDIGSDVRISEYSDDQFKYVKIDAQGVDENSIEVKVSEGVISASGEIRKNEETKDDSGISTSTYISSFNQSFSVPNGVKESSAKISVKEGIILIKFEKA